MMICPNKNAPEWIALEKAVGRFEALKDFMEYKGEIRTPKAVLFKLSTKNQTVSFFQKETGTSDGRVASENTIRDIAATMASRIGMDIVYVNDPKLSFKGKLDTSKRNRPAAIINLAYATMDTPIHEILGHPIVRAIKNKSIDNRVYKEPIEMTDQGEQYWVVEAYSEEGLEPEFFHSKEEAQSYYEASQSALYKNLLKELDYGTGKEVLDRIKQDYINKLDVKVDPITGYESFQANGRTYIKAKRPDVWYGTEDGLYKKSEWIGGQSEIVPSTKEEYDRLSKYSLEEQKEEALVELLGLMTANKLDTIKDSKLIGLLKRLLKEIKAFVRDLLKQREINVSNLPDNMTVGDLSDVLAYSNSKLILPGYQVKYTTPDNQEFNTYAEASKYISDLAKSDDKGSKLSDEKHVVTWSVYSQEDDGGFDEVHLSRVFASEEDAHNFAEGLNGGYVSNIRISKGAEFLSEEFRRKNRPYEQSKSIIEEWKKVNNIQYDPQEIYSRGQGFYSVLGAYSSFDTRLLLQNLIHHIEDNQKAGGEFIISAFTKPINQKIGHLEQPGSIKFKIHPLSKDIKWAANADVYSGSVWDAPHRTNSTKKSELQGVSYTKYPSLDNLHSIKSDLGSIVDDLDHHHNELGIALTGNNFRLEYDRHTPHDIKKIIDSINSILDQKFGKLKEPIISKDTNRLKAQLIIKDKAKVEHSLTDIRKKMETDYTIVHEVTSPDRIKEIESKVFNFEDKVTLEGMPGVADEFLYQKINNKWYAVSAFLNKEEIIKREFSEQAKINAKVVALKEAARAYPRSLIRSEIKPIPHYTKVDSGPSVSSMGFEPDELPFQRVSASKLKPYKVEVRNYLEKLMGLTLDKYGFIYNDLSKNDIGQINSKIKSLFVPENWFVRKSSTGKYYIAGTKNQSVLSETYAAYYKTGSLSELAAEQQKVYPLDNETNNQAQAIETLTEMARGLSNQLGAPYQFVTAEQAREITNGEWNGEPGFFIGGVSYFVGDNLRPDIILHEFSHPLVRSIAIDNHKLFENLYDKLAGTPEGKAIIEEVTKNYTNLQPGSDMFKEECIVRSLVLAAELDKSPLKEPTGFAKFIKDLLFAFKQLLRKAFGQKIDISKLNPNTTVKEIADMLTAGKNFKIHTEAVSQGDTVAYMKDMTGFINDMQKISKPELMALTTRVFDISTKHIDTVLNNKNYAEMLHILADEYDRGDLQEMRKNLSKYANTMTTRVNEIKDEIQFNKNHAAAMVDTMFRLEGMSEKILAHMEDLATDPDSKDNLQKAFYYGELIRSWSKFIDEAKQALDDQKIPSNSPMSQLVSSIDRTFEKARAVGQSMSAHGIRDVLYDELLPMGKVIDNRYNTIIADLKKRGAPQAIIDKYYKEYHGLSEKDQNRLTELEKANAAGRLTSGLKSEYETLKRQSFEGAKLTKEKIEKTLKGELGDANAFNSFFEGYMYNTDPIVGGFALYVKNQMTDVLASAQAKFNTFATDMAPLLEAAGYNPANVADLASKITNIQKVGSRDKDGNFVTKEVFTFLSPHQNYRLVVDEHRHAIDTTEKAYALTGTKEDQNKMIEAISALKTLQRKYFHQEYDPRYYELEGMLERDAIGQKAAYLRDNIFERMREITRTLETQGDEMNFAAQIDELWGEYRQLNSLYDLNGKKKTGEALAIAERLKEHKEASRPFHEWKERKGVFQNSLRTYEQELINNGIAQDSDAFRLARTEWINRNTRTVVKQSFYERRKVIMDRIAQIMSKVPDSVRKDIDIGPLYQAITDISYASRDDDNQPNGQDMTPESIAEVKTLQEQIMKVQKAFAGLNGLTEAESQELSALFDIVKKGDRKITIEQKNRMDDLLSKKTMYGLNNITKTELFKLFADLDIMQRKEATDYYVDVMNNWLDKLDTTKLKDRNKVGIINKVTANLVLEDDVIEDLLSQNQEFADWFHANHIRKTKYNPETKVKEKIWERVAIWNVTRPTDSEDYEHIDILDQEGNVVERLQGLPTTKYYVRRVKNEFRTKKVVGQTTDNRGQWLPRLDVADSPYINKEYEALRKSDPKLFAVLEKMSEHHLKNQEGLGYRSRLYLDIPRFRKSALEVVQTQQLKRTIKGAVAGRLPLLTLLVQRMKLFWQRGKDATEQGLNPHDDFTLVRADMFDNEVSSVPIAGLYDIELNDVSTDLTHSMMRYMLSAERQKKLIEINPIARALQNVVNDDKNQVKRLDAVNRFNFINRGIITYMNKKGMNTRRSAVNNFIEREFEGQTNTGMLTDVPWLNNTASLIFKRASFGFFALNIPSALKNTLGAKFQGMIEAAGGKYMNMKDFTKGEAWAFNTMGQVSFEIYKKGPKSLNIQLTEVFDALQGKFEEKFGESMSRTLASDTASLSWLYNFRKWTESQATLQTFAGMMHHQKVMQNGVEIDYINAWEVRDGKIQLKEGIDPSWGITYDKDGVMHIGDNFKMMKNRIHQVINSLNGAYASFDQPEAQRYLAFRFVSFLRRYFTTMAVNRWGFAGGFGNARGRMNPGLGDINEGYYITVMKTLSRMVTTDMKYLGFMTKDEKIAWIKTTTELFALIALSMILAPMFGWDPDDPDKYEKLRKKTGAMPFFGLVPEDPEHPFDGAGFLENHMLNLAMQVRSENEQFVPWPNFGLDDYTSMLDLKSLATGPTLKAYKQMFTVGLDEVTGDPSAFYKRSIGPYEWQQEGGSKFFNYLFKALGLTGSTLDPGTAIKNSQGIIIRGK